MSEEVKSNGPIDCDRIEVRSVSKYMKSRHKNLNGESVDTTYPLAETLLQDSRVSFKDGILKGRFCSDPDNRDLSYLLITLSAKCLFKVGYQEDITSGGLAGRLTESLAGRLTEGEVTVEGGITFFKDINSLASLKPSKEDFVFKFWADGVKAAENEKIYFSFPDAEGKEDTFCPDFFSYGNNSGVARSVYDGYFSVNSEEEAESMRNRNFEGAKIHLETFGFNLDKHTGLVPCKIKSCFISKTIKLFEDSLVVGFSLDIDTTEIFGRLS